MRKQRQCTCVILLAFMGLCVASPLMAQAPQTVPAWSVCEDRWFTVELGGAKAGWSHEVIETNGSQFRSDERMYLKIARGDTPMEIEMATTFVETADGKPVEMASEQKMSMMAVHMKWEFHPDHVQMTARQGQNETTSREPLPEGEWLTPLAVKRHVLKQIESKVESWSYRTVHPDNALEPFTVSTKRIGFEQYEHDGKSIPVTVLNSTTDVVPVDAIEKYDAEGNVVYFETELAMMGKLIVRPAASKEQAQAAGGPVPELLVKSFITPEKPIDRPEETVKAKLRLKIKNGTLPELPSSGAQTVEIAEDKKSALVMVDVDNRAPATPAELSDKEYQRASALVDSDDELIKKLAAGASRQAGGTKDQPGDDAMKRADAMRQLVHRHISRKGMETAFATASETAIMRTGDCSEHGVLLCALLRADGIPARVATGLMYVDSFGGENGIFGWHMWTQGLIDGHWVDFDATLDQRYHAVHVLTATSSLKNGMGAADLASVMQLMGNLDIEVVEVQYE